MLTELANTQAGLCSTLKETVPKGIAYHHSGLTSDERVIIEKAYRNGWIKILCATSTLSTGINLPAKAVIFKGPVIGKNLIDHAKYKQMSGRAGRTGFDKSGDSIVITYNAIHQQLYNNTLSKPFKMKLRSALTGPRLMRTLLETIASGMLR